MKNLSSCIILSLALFLGVESISVLEQGVRTKSDVGAKLPGCSWTQQGFGIVWNVRSRLTLVQRINEILLHLLNKSGSAIRAFLAHGEDNY